MDEFTKKALENIGRIDYVLSAGYTDKEKLKKISDLIKETMSLKEVHL